MTLFWVRRRLVRCSPVKTGRKHLVFPNVGHKTPSATEHKRFAWCPSACSRFSFVHGHDSIRDVVSRKLSFVCWFVRSRFRSPAHESAIILLVRVRSEGAYHQWRNNRSRLADYVHHITWGRLYPIRGSIALEERHDR